MSISSFFYCARYFMKNKNGGECKMIVYEFYCPRLAIPEKESLIRAPMTTNEDRVNTFGQTKLIKFKTTNPLMWSKHFYHCPTQPSCSRQLHVFLGIQPLIFFISLVIFLLKFFQSLLKNHHANRTIKRQETFNTVQLKERKVCFHF